MVPPAAWSEPPDPRSNRPENLDDSRWQVPAAEVHELAPRASRYCILIPVLDEGERIRRQLVAMQHRGAGADVIITDGGSTDGSMNLEFLRQHGVRALLIKRGPGRVGAQLRIGFAYCLRQGYEGIVTIDGNGKDGVEALASFLEALDQGARDRFKNRGFLADLFGLHAHPLPGLIGEFLWGAERLRGI